MITYQPPVLAMPFVLLPGGPVRAQDRHEQQHDTH